MTQGNLDQAELEVKASELSPAFMKFLIRQPFWTDYLNSHYPRRFASVNAVYPAKLQAVFEKADSLATADYLSQVTTIKAEKEAAENSVFESLTRDALKLAELGICAVPGD